MINGPEAPVYTLLYHSLHCVTKHNMTMTLYDLVLIDFRRIFHIP
jgi:hypothetical protein